MWSEPCLDLVIDYIERVGLSDEAARIVLGVALLAQRDDQRLFRLVRLLEDAKATLDTPLLLNMLEHASAQHIASVLNSPIGRYLSPDAFERLYWNSLATLPDNQTSYELLAAAADFLRVYPGTFTISDDLVFSLMRSPNIEARIVAMKALWYSTVPLAQHVDCILAYFESASESEKEMGLYNLGELTQKHGVALLKSIGSERVQKLLQILDTFAKDTSKDKSLAAVIQRDTILDWMGAN